MISALGPFIKAFLVRPHVCFASLLHQFLIIAKYISSSSWYVYFLWRSVYYCVLHGTSPIWCYANFQLLTLILPKSHHELPLVYFSLVCVSVVYRAIIFLIHWNQIFYNQAYMMSLELCFQFAIIWLTNPMWKQMHIQRMSFAAMLGCCKGQMRVWLDSGYLQWYSGYATLCSSTDPESCVNTEQCRSAGHKNTETCKSNNTVKRNRQTHNVYKYA